MKRGVTTLILLASLAMASGGPSAKEPPATAKEWLQRELDGARGSVDQAAVARALDRRSRMVREARLKFAGLPAIPSDWTNLTGYAQAAGRVNHIAFTSTSGNDILAGTDDGGIWRTSDGGATWTVVDNFLSSIPIANFASDTSGATRYAGTNPRGSDTYFPYGVIKSIDGGATWTQVADPSALPAFTHVQRVAVRPDNPQYVLAATDQGAWTSSDGGTTWTAVPGSMTSYSVAIHPTDGNRQVVAYDDGTLRYTTSGDLVSQALTATVLNGGRFMKVAYAKSDANRMYALVADGAFGTTRLFESTNGAGGPWVEVPPSFPTGVLWNDNRLIKSGALWVDPLNPARVALCEYGCAFTANIDAAAPVWKKMFSGSGDFQAVVEHPGYDGGSNATVFFMDSGGLYRVAAIDALDQPAQVSRIDHTMALAKVYSVSVQGANPIFGAQGIGPRAYRLGADLFKWRFIARPESFAPCPPGCWLGDGTTTAASASAPSLLYGSTSYLNLFRSADGGITAYSIAGTTLTEGRGAASPNDNASFLSPFVLDPSNPNRMLAGGQSLWRSDNVATNSPPTWTAIRAPRADTQAGCGYIAPIARIAIAPTNPDVVWLAYECDGAVFKSVDATQPAPTWARITTLPTGAASSTKASILIDRDDPARVWIGLGQYQDGTLLQTRDGGSTWQTLTGLPGAPVYALTQHPSNAVWLYAGTGVGLFASMDKGANWSASADGPTNVAVRSLDWTGSPAVLYAGTFGRGVYKATVPYYAFAASSTSVAASTRSAVQGTPIAFTATISLTATGRPWGSVIFRDGATELATVPVTGSIIDRSWWYGWANYQTSALGPGTHAVTAEYLGDEIFRGSSSTPVSVTVTPTDAIPRLTGISTRMQVLTGDDVLIGGFVIGGSTPKKVVINARGPSLASQGVAGALADPTLQVVSAGDGIVRANDNWPASANSAELTMLGLAPPDTHESSVLATLSPGAYTAIVSGVGGGTGIGIIEIYEVDHPEVPLVGISARGRVLTGDNVMIGGFIVQGTGPQTVVVRARGPSLASQGVADALPDPVLQLISAADGTVITNDNWQAAANASTLRAIGYAPTDARESALLVSLNPGAYTAIVSGAGGATGVAIVEVYVP